MTAAFAVAGPAEAPGLSFGLTLSGYDQRELTAVELGVLGELGAAGVRRSRARGAADRAALWAQLTRLVRPLDDARAMLSHPGHARYRRASAHAAGLVLQHCTDSGRVYWAWTPADWASLCGSSAEAFLAARVTPTETTVRPFLVALGYLLGGFDDFQLLGTFNRLHLAQLVFGVTAVEDSIRGASQTLNRWGYRGVLGRHRLRGGLSQALLINRTPRLADLDTAAFARLRAHPATNDHHGELLSALQRAAAGLGHCDPPVRTGRSHMPTIEGADPTWAGWVERWHATSPLTPKVRASSARSWPRPDGGWLPSTPRSPSRRTGHGRPARPGSPRSIGCASVTTCNAPTAWPVAPACRSPRAPRHTC